MSIYNFIILSGAASAALVAWGRWRYLVWIGAMMASYVASVMYWDFSGSRPEFFAAICDLTIVIAIALCARYIWELWIAFLFLASSFVNMVYLAGNLTGAGIFDHIVYSSILEAINLIAIIIIGGTAAFDKAGMVNGLAFRPWLHIFGRLRPVYSRHSPRS